MSFSSNPLTSWKCQYMDGIHNSEFKDRYVTLSVLLCLPLTTFLQIYFMDGTAPDPVQGRRRITDGLRPDMLLDLQETFQTNHLYVRKLKAAYEFANTNSPDYRITSCESRKPAGSHERTNNASLELQLH